MRNVRCPRCKSEHRLAADAPGYVCSGCGTEWVFARCEQCHSSFHAPAGTASWTCKRCGFRNVSAAGPEPEPAAAPREAGPSLLDRGRARWRGLSQRGKLIAIAAPLIVIVVVVAGVLLSGGGSGPSGASLAVIKGTYCLHSRGLFQESDRAPAVSRAADQIHKDAAAFRRAGDAATARELKAVVRLARKLASAIRSNTGISAALHTLLKAAAKGPSC